MGTELASKLDVDPDATFHFDADPDPDPDHNSANLHCFYLSRRRRHSSHNFQYFGQYFKISGKRIVKL
jgi:hypothetical protein